MMSKLRLLPSQMSQEQFISAFQEIYEFAGVVKVAHPSITPSHDTPKALHKLLSETFNALPDPAKLSMLKTYPLLSGPTLTKASSAEQASQGLDALPEHLKQRFSDLNHRYQARFGWPFIIVVKDYTVAEILDAMEKRVGEEKEEEFAQACRGVNRIAEIRLAAWFQENHPDIQVG